MKKTISMLSILLALAVLLCACAGEPEPTTVPTTEPTTAPTTEPTTASTTEPMTESTTEPTTAPTTVPTTGPQETVPAWENLTQPTVESSDEMTDVGYFQQLLDFKNGHEQNGYNAALNCVFEKPEDLSLNEYFWTHFVPEDDWEDFSEDEEAYLIGQGLNRDHNAQKRSVGMMDAVLQAYFGHTLSAFSIPENWVYYEETDCYYTTGTSPLVLHDFTVTEVEYEENAIVHVHYQYRIYNLEMYVLTLQEKPQGESGYYILSNLPIEKE